MLFTGTRLGTCFEDLSEMYYRSILSRRTPDLLSSRFLYQYQKSEDQPTPEPAVESPSGLAFEHAEGTAAALCLLQSGLLQGVLWSLGTPAAK